MKKIDAPSLKAMINDGAELALLDVREDGQFGQGHLLFANPLPYSVLESRVDARVPRRSTRVVLVDDADGVAEMAAVRLEACGYSDVAVLYGGVAAWQEAGYEIFKGVNVPCKAFGEVVEVSNHTPSISAEELQAMFDAGDDLVVLDSRTPAEFNRMSIPNGINVPGAELAYRVHDLAPSPDTLVVVNCAGRTRSIIGAQSLINAGIDNKVVALRGGTQGWVLAGLELDHGATAKYGDVSTEGAAKAESVAVSVRARYGVKTIDRATLDAWRSETDERTLYIFDVRDLSEYEKGHLPGAIAAPGGQLVQGTDVWMATRGARVVLTDDNGVRAAMTAHWLLQMRWDVYVLDDAGDLSERAASANNVLGLDDQNIETIEPAALAAELEAGTAVAVDVDLSLDYRKACLPGAVWAVRPRLPAAVRSLPAGRKVVLYSEHETRARLAVIDARGATDAPVLVLKGGREAWTAAGLPTEHSPESPKDADCIDFLFWVHDRHEGNEDSMRDYLAWEEQLPAQIEADGDAQFRIP
tara:strand:- start:103 stop:1683 length:1581 start_codon:yes stop_codon:yes gene_type:complete